MRFVVSSFGFCGDLYGCLAVPLLAKPRQPHHNVTTSPRRNIFSPTDHRSSKTTSWCNGLDANEGLNVGCMLAPLMVATE